MNDITTQELPKSLRIAGAIGMVLMLTGIGTCMSGIGRENVGHYIDNGGGIFFLGLFFCEVYGICKVKKMYEYLKGGKKND